jgi:hypothetical protein
MSKCYTKTIMTHFSNKLNETLITPIDVIKLHNVKLIRNEVFLKLPTPRNNSIWNIL